jgi:hypothetical protein
MQDMPAVAELSERAVILAGVSITIPPVLREQARYQAGVITRGQALKSGMPVKAIRWKLKRGAWRQLYRGVYVTFTGPVPRDAQLWAAVLYAGRGALLSHETAAEIHRLTDRRSPLIHVTIPAARRVIPPKGVVIHRSSLADPGWRFPRGVPPHTFVEETIVDLVTAATNLDDVIGWVTTAFGRGLAGQGPLRKTMAERNKLRWRSQLDEIITAAAGGTHSVLEYRHDRDVQRAHGLPSARKQVPFTKPDGSRGFRDRYYEQYGGLVIELDGKQAHPGERRGEDQDRDNDAAAKGGSTLRYGWGDITRKACETAAQEAEALHERGWTGALKPCSPTCRAVSGSRARARHQRSA